MFGNWITTSTASEKVSPPTERVSTEQAAGRVVQLSVVASSAQSSSASSPSCSSQDRFSSSRRQSGPTQFSLLPSAPAKDAALLPAGSATARRIRHSSNFANLSLPLPNETSTTASNNFLTTSSSVADGRALHLPPSRYTHETQASRSPSPTVVEGFDTFSPQPPEPDLRRPASNNRHNATSPSQHRHNRLGSASGTSFRPSGSTDPLSSQSSSSSSFLSSSWSSVTEKLLRASFKAKCLWLRRKLSSAIAMMNPEVLRSMRVAAGSGTGVCGALRGLANTAYQRGAAFNKVYCTPARWLSAISISALVGIFMFKGLGSGAAGGSTSAGFALPRPFNLRHSSHGVQRTSPCTVSEPCTFTIVADLDVLSKVERNGKDAFISYTLTGWLWESSSTSGADEYKLDWLTRETELEGKYNEGGRGMELSELVRFDSKLYAFDDRTGIVFEIGLDGSAVARHVLTEGDGSSTKGMKIEWATVKGDKIWIGSIGKEFTSGDGKKIMSGSPFWVVTLNSRGEVTHLNWESNYTKMRKALNAEFPGYLIHEAVAWSAIMQRWIVLPRRVSDKPYDEVLDEERGATKMLVCSENFDEIKVVDVGRPDQKPEPRRGFSSVKFVPGTDDKVLVALKSEENAEAGTQQTFITIFTIDGLVLLADQLIPSSHKYEGIEFNDK